MRFFAVALVVFAGCEFHVQGGAPPGGPIQGPGSPGAPGTTTGNAGNGGTGGGGNPGDPGDPTGGTSGNPNTPPPLPADMATEPVTPGADMATTMTPPPQPPLVRVGQACNGDPDCMEPDLKCFKTLGKGGNAVGLPGGYCSKVCDAKIRCPTGSECVATIYGDFCMNICPAGGCRTGYSCCVQVNACGLTQFCGGQS